MYQETSFPSTVIPITYVESYKDPVFKKHIARYKFDVDFSKEWYAARSYIQTILHDIYIDTQQEHVSRSSYIFFTSPPSTMYERKEKILDTTKDLFMNMLPWKKMFGVHRSYLKHHKAEHIDGNRHTRMASKEKYTLYWLSKLQLWFIIMIARKRIIQIYIVDDISTTGSTLKNCSDILCIYLQKWQKKKPDMRFSIRVFSIGH